MTTAPPTTEARALPQRFEQMSAASFVACVAALAFFIWSLKGTQVSIGDLLEGFPQMGRLVGEMLPPSGARLEAVGRALLETFQMALVGTVVGVLLSVPLAVLRAKAMPERGEVVR